METEIVVLDEVFDEVDDFYRVSVECHKAPSISASDDYDEGNITEWEVDDEYCFIK